MTDNQVISEWRGECRHVYQALNDTISPCTKCKVTLNNATAVAYYSTDPAAWTPELYQEIEDENLKGAFLRTLSITINGMWRAGSVTQVSEKELWLWVISTPQQKAQALARAIKEVEG